MAVIRKPTNDLSIRPKVSRSVIMTFVIIGLFGFLASMYFVYGYGVRSGHAKYEEDQATVAQLNQSMASMKVELQAAQKNLSYVQRQQQIQEEAYRQITKAYANSEQKNSVLESRVDFLRSIVSPEDGQSGPAIQDLQYEYADGKLSFDVTLVQAIQHKHQVRGNLTVTLFEGDVVAGQWPTTSSRSVNYQYFQKVSGVIERATLADAAKLKVELSIKGGEKLERWFNLAKLKAAPQVNQEIVPVS